MKRKPSLNLLAVAGLALLVGLLLGRFLAPGDGSGSSVIGSAAALAAPPVAWTCSMHPQIQQPSPGDCPICGMDLIPLQADGGADEGPRTLSMSESSKALAAIQTSAVERGFPAAQIRLVGKLAYDETKEKSLTARFPARIDELFVNYTGIAVKKGEHLAKVYSPELLTAQRELLTAYRNDPDSLLAAAAREKLRLWDLLPEQIDAILESGQAKDHFVLRAPIGGIVVSKKVSEGDYVKMGETLFRIVDLDQLWLYLEAYESDLAWLRYGQEVLFSVESYPGEVFHGQISFIEPLIDSKTRTAQVRVNVSNAERRLKPGMFAKGVVEANLAAGGKVLVPGLADKWISPMHPEIVKDGPGSCDVCGMDLVPARELGYVSDGPMEAALFIPATAVMRTGKRAIVYVEKPDADRPTFQGREIVLGPRAGDSFVVMEGLEEGERVVTKGAFKIDSSLQIQGKASMMNPEVEERDAAKAMSSASIEVEAREAALALDAYLALQAALAGDDLAAARLALAEILDALGGVGTLSELAREMQEAKDLESLRRPLFETFSNALIAAVKADAGQFHRSVTLMYCPMVYPDRGAYWLQGDDTLRNPYYGSMMLRCGETMETFKGNEESSR